MPAISPQVIDWAFDSGLAKGDRNYWKNLDSSSSEWKDFVAAIRGPLIDWAFSTGVARGNANYWRNLDPASQEWQDFFSAIGAGTPEAPDAATQPAPAQPTSPPQVPGPGGSPAPIPEAPQPLEPFAGKPGQLVPVAPGQPTGVRLNGVPGEPQVWRHTDGTAYVVYHLTTTDPPIPMGWRVGSDEALQSMFGQDPIVVNFSGDVFSQGLLEWGDETELADFPPDGDPIQVWLDQVESESRVRPYLRDPEVLAITFAAYMEGRGPSEAELQATQWWQTHSEDERRWLITAEADPMTALQTMRDNRFAIAESLRQAGVANAPDDLVNLIADHWTSGLWTATYVQNQVGLIADPFATGQLDPQITALNISAIDTSAQREQFVREQAINWLGPLYGKLADSEIRRWAGTIRNDPDGEDAFTEHLSNQRLALFPAYENPNVTYEGIVAPWRGRWSQITGEDPDETDSDFIRFVQFNDDFEASSFLRNRALDRELGTATHSAIDALDQALGGQVRRL